MSSWQVQARGAALLRRHGLLPRPGHPFHGKLPPPGVGPPVWLEGTHSDSGDCQVEPPPLADEGTEARGQCDLRAEAAERAGHPRARLPGSTAPPLSASPPMNSLVPRGSSSRLFRDQVRKTHGQCLEWCLEQSKYPIAKLNL